MAPTIKEVARDRAAVVLDSYWPEGSIPVDPYVIADRAGLRVLSAQLEGDVSGVLRKRPFETPEIWLDIDDSSARRAFTCAHELGHYFDRAPDDDEQIGYIDRRDGKTTPAEVFANQFAANLLMPANHVHDMHDDGVDPIAMAQRFGVSMAALRNRLATLNLLA